MRIRIAQGHNERLVSSEEADYLLATAWYSNLDTEEAESRSSAFGVTVLSAADTPKRIHHRQWLGIHPQGGSYPWSQEVGAGTLLLLILSS